MKNLFQIALALVISICFFGCTSSGDDDDNNNNDDEVEITCTVEEYCLSYLDRCIDMSQDTLEECLEFVESNANNPECDHDAYLACICECIGLKCHGYDPGPDPSIMDCKNECSVTECEFEEIED